MPRAGGARRADKEGDFVTLQDIEGAAGITPSLLDTYLALPARISGGLARPFRKCPSVAVDDIVDPRKDDWTKAMKVLFDEGAKGSRNVKLANNNMFGKQNKILKAADQLFNGDYYAADGIRHVTGRAGLTRQPKQYTKEEFGYRLLQSAWTIPDSGNSLLA
ncbi:hypothetical protein CYMTET_17805 [Cymbomonas tetramitiformis]|uniref:Uncharacterized protein n=1 Tax=Cymbomonas tetramitiformis TaxID=36881 RepID=A0AAE0G9L5_9CHLO|nr:hypothetical protein CYMTET_17805 [Cymbomonas tetramitiformis]